MGKERRKPRLTHNQKILQQIYARLQEYSLEEVRMICERYKKKHPKKFEKR